MTKIDLDDLEAKAKAAGGDEWFASVIGLRVNATNAKIGGETPICDIRGWGYLTGQGHGALGLSEKEAIAVQRAIADYIASANPATMLALTAHIRELKAMNEDFLEQITAQTESVLFKELQEIMKANNALHNENTRLKQLVDLADALRAAQRAYMADRGNNQLGRAVANAAKSYDDLRSLGGVRSCE
jgi:regulator of replication initiation timing